MDLDALIRATREGDTFARDQVGRWLHAELRAFLVQRFPKDQVEDVLNDTMLDIWRKLPDQPERNAKEFLEWAFSFAGTATKAARGETRREHARAAKAMAQAQLDVLEQPTSAVTRVLTGQQKRLLRRHLWRLPPIFRNTLRHYLDDGSDGSLAKAEGISRATVRWRRQEGIRRLIVLIERARLSPGTTHT